MIPWPPRTAKGESLPQCRGVPPPFRAPSRAPPDHILSLRFKPGIGIAFGTSFGSTPRRHWTGRAFDGSRSPQQDKAGRADDARLKSGPVTRVRTRRVCCCKIMCLCWCLNEVLITILVFSIVCVQHSYIILPLYTRIPQPDVYSEISQRSPRLDAGILHRRVVNRWLRTRRVCCCKIMCLC